MSVRYSNGLHHSKTRHFVRFSNGRPSFWYLWTQTIRKPDIFVRFSNGLLPQIPNYHLKTGQSCLVFKWHLNTGPFDNRTCLDHSNTGLVRYSDGYCSPEFRSCLYVRVLVLKKNGHKDTTNMRQRSYCWGKSQTGAYAKGPFTNDVIKSISDLIPLGVNKRLISPPFSVT